MSPLEVVQQWETRAWTNADLTAVDDLIAEEIIRHGPSGTVVRSRAQIKDDLRQYQRALHKPTIIVNDRVVDGDKVWSRLTMRGVNLETGDKRTVGWLQIQRVVDGLIVESWTLYASDIDWE